MLEWGGQGKLGRRDGRLLNSKVVPTTEEEGSAGWEAKTEDILKTTNDYEV
jgi:hypothetical protein